MYDLYTYIHMDMVRKRVKWLTDPIHIAEPVNFIRTME